MSTARRTATTAALTALVTAGGLLLTAPAFAEPGRQAPAGPRGMMNGPAMEKMMASQGDRGMSAMMQTPAMKRMHAQMSGPAGMMPMPAGMMPMPAMPAQPGGTGS